MTGLMGSARTLLFFELSSNFDWTGSILDEADACDTEAEVRSEVHGADDPQTVHTVDLDADELLANEGQMSDAEDFWFDD